MAECYIDFPRLPNYELSTRTLMERTNRLRGSKPEIRITATQLRSIRAPTLLVWGDHDPFSDVATGRRIADLIPDSRFHLLPGGGHLPWLDDPVTAGRLVTEFLHDHQPAMKDPTP